MGSGASTKTLQAAKRRLERKHGRPYTILRASNGESAVLPACRTCGKASPEWAPCEHEKAVDVVDVLVENHGSIFLFRPLTVAAKDWIAEHVQDDAQFLGEALAVEHRYAHDLALGMQADGLKLK